MATRDIDLLWDVARRVQFATALKRVDTSMLAVLKKVDASFRIRKSQKYTAVNKNGFEVDIIRRQPIDSPPFSSVIVASNGEMARMNTLHPLVFAKFKHWLAELPGRDPRKRQRDELQATSVEAVVRKYLPQLERDFAVPELAPVSEEAARLTTGLEVDRRTGH